MRTNMQRDYAKVPKGGNRPRSSFKVGGRRLLTMYGGQLVPFFWTWAFPGDIFRGKYHSFVRAISPLEFPLFDNIQFTIHTHFVPLRILWDNARKFFGEQVDPGDSIDYTLPVFSNSAIDTNSVGTQLYANLQNYLEVPRRTAADGGVDGADICAIPFRAYYSIYNTEYRDQNMVNSLTVATDDGPDSPTAYQVRARGKRHDYFTSLLSAPQKGDAVPFSGDVETDASITNPVGIYSNTDGWRRLDSDAANVDVSNTATNAETYKLKVDLLITDLRNAAAIQQFLERDNRYGTRFDEVLYAHYGVEFNEPRWRSVYLGGGSGNINTTPIAQTTTSSDGGVGDNRELGDLAAIASGSLDGAGFTYAVDEPGIIMAIANINADLSYHQGIPRKHLLRTRYDMLFEEFQGIGDRAVLTKEIYYQNNATDDVVLGYTPRYEEFRTDVNRVAGYFDPNHYDGGLEVMHLAEDFGSAPVLGSAFITQNNIPWARMLRVTNEEHFLADIVADIKVARQLSTYGTPGMNRL